MNLVIDASNIITGGGLTHLVELLRYAKPVKYGFETVKLWAPDKTLQKIESREWLTKKNHRLLNKGYASRLIWKYFTFKNSLNDQDLVYMPGTSYISCKNKVVTMCRNLLPLEKKELNRFYPSKIWLRLRLLRILHLRAFQKADGVIFLNEYCYSKTEALIKQLIDYAIIPHGVNRKFKFHRTDFGINESFNLLYVSALDLYKHQWLIAEAVLRLRKKGYQVSLTLIGESFAGTEKKLEKVLSQYPSEQKHVNWLGKSPYKSLSGHYIHADAFIYGSTCETFGMTLLEAMAASLPIACSGKSSMRSMLEDTGIYFDPENVSSVENAIMKLYNDQDLREQLGRESYQLATNYHWQTTADETLEYLSKIASS